jgi:hypothetical protein
MMSGLRAWRETKSGARPFFTASAASVRGSGLAVPQAESNKRVKSKELRVKRRFIVM